MSTNNDEDPKTDKLRNLIKSAEREEIHWFTRCSLVKTLHEKSGLSQGEIAEQFGFHLSEIGCMIKIASFPRELAEAARSGRYARAVFIELSKVAQKPGVMQKIQGFMAAGRDVTVQSVREAAGKLSRGRPKKDLKTVCRYLLSVHSVQSLPPNIQRIVREQGL